MKKEVTVPS